MPANVSGEINASLPGSIADTVDATRPLRPRLMLKPALPLLLVCLFAATAADAQYGGGGGGGGRGQPSSTGTTPAAAPARVVKPAKPTNQIEIVGVVQAIDLAANRVTIAYDAVDELGWPRGVMPFGVYKSELLKTVTPGERVRFRLDDQQITDIGPYVTAPPGPR